MGRGARTGVAAAACATLVACTGEPSARPAPPAPTTVAPASPSASAPVAPRPTRSATPPPKPSPKPTATTARPSPTYAVPAWSEPPMRSSYAGVAMTTVERRGGGPGDAWLAKYPTLRGMPRAAAERANDTLAAAVDAAVRPPGDDPQETVVNPKLSAVDDNYVTVRLDVYTYDGGAHGGTRVTTYVFERGTGRRLSLLHLVSPDAEAVGAISGYVRERLPVATQAQPPSGEWEGAGPDAANFAAFTPLPEGLEVTFQEYQVAAYALGTPVVVVPWSLLEPFMAMPYPTGERDPAYRDGDRLDPWLAERAARAARRDSRVGARPLERLQRSQVEPRYALATLADGRRVAFEYDGDTVRVVAVAANAGCAFPHKVRAGFALRC